MNIAVIMVNYRTPELVLECLKSIPCEFDRGYRIRVFVGDSCSGDHSAAVISDYIAQHCADWCRFIPIDRNGGFAYGNNYLVEHGAMAEGAFDFIHFLNPDTYIHPGAITELADFLRQRSDVGVAGSRLENPDGSDRSFAFRFPAPWRQFHAGARLGLIVKLFPSAPVVIDGLRIPTPVDWVSGASFMVPIRVVETVGLMDAGYFLYYEEIDYMYRVQKAGYQVWHVPASRIVHLAGQSTGVRHNKEDLRRLPPYWFQSRYKFLRDHYGRIRAVGGILLYLLGDLLYRFKCLVTARRIEDPPHLLGDLLRYGFSLPSPRD